MYRGIFVKIMVCMLCVSLFVPAFTNQAKASEMVDLKDLVVKWGGIVETEPNYSMKTNAGKFGPQELEYGLFLKPEMKFGYGNVNGMMAPLRDMIRALPGTFTWDGSLKPGKITINLNE